MTVKEFIEKQKEERVRARENAAATQQALEERVQNATAEEKAVRNAARKPKRQG